MVAPNHVICAHNELLLSKTNDNFPSEYASESPDHAQYTGDIKWRMASIPQIPVSMVGRWKTIDGKLLIPNGLAFHVIITGDSSLFSGQNSVILHWQSLSVLMAVGWRSMNEGLRRAHKMGIARRVAVDPEPCVSTATIIKDAH